MKEFNISRDSWHYKLARNFGFSTDYQGKSDICKYTKYLITGLFISLLLTFLGIMTAYVFVEMILGIVFSIIAGAWIISEVGIAGIFLSTIIGTLITVNYSVDAYRNYRWNKSDSEPGFIRTAYLSWKNKYCVKLSFSENEET